MEEETILPDIGGNCDLKTHILHRHLTKKIIDMKARYRAGRGLNIVKLRGPTSMQYA